MSTADKVGAVFVLAGLSIIILVTVIALIHEFIYTPLSYARKRAQRIAYDKELASSKIKPVHGEPHPYIFQSVVQVEYRTDSASFDISHLYEQMMRSDFRRIEHSDIWSADHWPHHGLIV